MSNTYNFKKNNASRIKAATNLAKNNGLNCDFIHNSFSSNEASKKTYSFSDLTNIDDKSVRGFYFYNKSIPTIAVIKGKALNKLIAEKASVRKVRNGLIRILNLTDILSKSTKQVQ